jgi:hypothetical protein
MAVVKPFTRDLLPEGCASLRQRILLRGLTRINQRVLSLISVEGRVPYELRAARLAL